MLWYLGSLTKDLRAEPKKVRSTLVRCPNRRKIDSLWSTSGMPERQRSSLGRTLVIKRFHGPSSILGQAMCLYPT